MTRFAIDLVFALSSLSHFAFQFASLLFVLRNMKKMTTEICISTGMKTTVIMMIALCNITYVDDLMMVTILRC